MRKTHLMGEGTVENPTEEDVRRMIREADKPGDIDDVSLFVRDDEEGYDRRIYFWIKSDTELVAFFESNQNEYDLISMNDSNEDDQCFSVRYFAGGEWPMGTRSIISTEQGIKYALELLRTGNINTEKGWIRFRR